MRVVPEAEDDGVYLNIFLGTGHARIGPISSHTEYRVTIESSPEVGRVAPSQRLRKRSQKEEAKLAADVGGRAQPNSGALPWAKGDVRLRGKHRIESKITGNATYRVSREDLDKIRSECAFREKAAFVITFINKNTLREEDRWVLTPYEDWHEAHVDRGPEERGAETDHPRPEGEPAAPLREPTGEAGRGRRARR